MDWPCPILHLLLSHRQDWLYNLQGPVQTEIVEPSVQKLLTISNDDGRVSNQEWGPYKHGALYNYTQVTRTGSPPYTQALILRTLSSKLPS